jgi:hypothetical protein
MAVREEKAFTAFRQGQCFAMMICCFKANHQQTDYQDAILQTKSASK